MDSPSNFRQPGQKRRQKKPGSKPQLYEDTSMQQPPPPQYGYGPPPGQGNYDPNAFAGMPGSQILNDPMANMAMQYGSSLADQGKDYVNKNLEKYVATSRLKYYFAVDTAYVGKKLGLLLFPFTQSDWSIKYNSDEPVQPRFELNAPDLYIPSMAFVTYVLVAGIVLGTQNRFTPEQLGIQASSAFVWLIIELVVIMISLYIMNVNTNLKYTDVIAYCGYKFVGMIFALIAGLVFLANGYYCVLLWFGITISVFLIRTLRVQLLSQTADDGFSRGSKRSWYLILSISLLQPLMMWWLTSHIMFHRI
ncbi:protein YIF1B-like isoform X1 [Mytilus edulis]|uniref:protein YIF1B-like isoform X1 n=2 Tax=Mytilus edulis TaxID=6550 RepID=UPI0039F10182